jgi:hypothetical protein
MDNMLLEKIHNIEITTCRKTSLLVYSEPMEVYERGKREGFRLLRQKYLTLKYRFFYGNPVITAGMILFRW